MSFIRIIESFATLFFGKPPADSQCQEPVYIKSDNTILNRLLDQGTNSVQWKVTKGLYPSEVFMRKVKEATKTEKDPAVIAESMTVSIDLVKAATVVLEKFDKADTVPTALNYENLKNYLLLPATSLLSAETYFAKSPYYIRKAIKLGAEEEKRKNPVTFEKDLDAYIDHVMKTKGKISSRAIVRAFGRDYVQECKRRLLSF